MKLWLTLITQNRLEDVTKLTEYYDVFDGIVAVDHFSNDGSYELLESRKKAGKIIQLPFCKNHGWSMNGFLFSGVIKNLDWFLICDSSNIINSAWVKRIREDIKYWSKNNIWAIYLDRIYLARYISGMEFYGDSHWGLKGIKGNILDISKINGYRKENWIINGRNKNPHISAIEHPIKYFIEYEGDTQIRLLYQQFGEEVYQKHLLDKIYFRIFVDNNLGFPCTVDNIIKYISEGIKNKNLPNFMVDYIEQEVNMIDLVRYYILKHDFFGEIAPNRFNWSFKKFYNEGIEHQNKNDGFIGCFNEYRLAKGLEME